MRADHPPTVAVQTPDDGTLIDPATTPSVMVSAAASDDIRVSRVDFLLNGALQASDGDFPFTWNMPAASVSSGATTLTARAYDSRGQHADASVTLLKDPPTVTSVTGGALRGNSKSWARTSGAASPPPSGRPPTLAERGLQEQYQDRDQGRKVAQDQVPPGPGGADPP